MPTVHLLITGKVQGVFYRAGTQEKAMELGLSGWVKNTVEGHVEAMVSGSEEKVAQFIDWCRQGPSRAQVTDVIVTPKPDDGFTGFHILK